MSHLLIAAEVIRWFLWAALVLGLFIKVVRAVLAGSVWPFGLFLVACLAAFVIRHLGL